jgi:DNA-binding NtrC family response regulator
MRELFSLVERVARSDAPVLICGETGTGKELVAEAIHAASPRAAGPFVVCDLSAVRSTLLESELFGHRRGAFTSADHERSGAFARAHGGTIFLDEVGELGETAQPRLLRAIERREIKPVGGESFRSVDVRILAATNRDLDQEAKSGRFRSDLYHRLAVVRLVVPPLRERRDDIPLLAEHIVAEFAAAQGRPAPLITGGAMELLREYEWPGNIRELRNVLQRGMSLAPSAPVLDWKLLRVDRPAAKSGARPLGSEWKTFKEARDALLGEWEYEYLREVLERAEGNVSKAARFSGVARGHLYRLLKKHGFVRSA